MRVDETAFRGAKPQRANGWIERRPGYGRVVINLFVEACVSQVVRPIPWPALQGNCRGSSELATPEMGKSTILVDFEAGRVETFVNSTCSASGNVCKDALPLGLNAALPDGCPTSGLQPTQSCSAACERWSRPNIIDVWDEDHGVSIAYSLVNSLSPRLGGQLCGLSKPGRVRSLETHQLLQMSQC